MNKEVKVLRLQSWSRVSGVESVYKTKLFPLSFLFFFFTFTPLLELHRCTFCFLHSQKNFLFKIPVQRFECIDIPIDESMSAKQAYGESNFGQFDNVVTIRPLSVLYCTRPNLLVPFRTQKRTAVKAFATGELGCCTLPRAKPVVMGSTEPVNMVVAGGAAAKVADSDDGGDGDRSMSPGSKSDDAAKDDDGTMNNDLGYQQPNDKMMDNGAGEQVLDNRGNDPQPTKYNKTVGFNSLLSSFAYCCRIVLWKPLRQTLRPSGSLQKPLLCLS